METAKIMTAMDMLGQQPNIALGDLPMKALPISTGSIQGMVQ
jgi:hypothetical protein